MPLNVHFPAINPNRWNHTPGQVTPNPAEYDALRDLAQDLRGQGIAFFVIQPPVRHEAALKGDSPAALRAHFQRVESVLASSGATFINMQPEMDLPDSEFADYSHLNAEGSRIFTEAIAQRIGARIDIALHG